MPPTVPVNHYSDPEGQRLEDPTLTDEIFNNPEFLSADDSPKDRQFFSDLFKEMTLMLAEPFAVDTFDFGDDRYFNKVYAFAENLASIPELKNSKVARGSQDGLYVNRTYYGLYAMLNELKASIVTTKPEWLKSKKLLAQVG